MDSPIVTTAAPVLRTSVKRIVGHKAIGDVSFLSLRSAKDANLVEMLDPDR